MAAWDGGALYLDPEYGATIQDSIFSGNVALEGGGAIYLCCGGALRIERCVISENVALGHGGGVYSSTGSRTQIRDCLICDNQAAYGGGMSHGGGFLTLLGTTLTGNAAQYEGGAARIVNCDQSLIAGCTIHANSGGTGGGIFVDGWTGDASTLINTLLTDNEATELGGALACERRVEVNVANCTFHQNQAALGGAVVSDTTGGVQIANCVLWANAAQEGDALAVLNAEEPASMTISYCDVMHGLDATYVAEGALLDWGEGNIDQDPRFVSLADGDFRLRPYSPCIDAANSDAVPSDAFDLDGDACVTEPIAFDLAGQPRFVDNALVTDTGAGTPPIVDMGAFEFQVTCPGDIDEDAVISAADLFELLDAYGTRAGDPAYLPAADLIADGCIDLGDLAALLAVFGESCR